MHAFSSRRNGVLITPPTVRLAMLVQGYLRIGDTHMPNGRPVREMHMPNGRPARDMHMPHGEPILHIHITYTSTAPGAVPTDRS